ncbi:MAG: hypothetical protein AMXMBFR13_29090 [Phycisphaerae bacterium]
MAFVTLLVAGLFVWGTHVALDGADWDESDAHQWVGVRSLNSARVLGAMMAPSSDEPEEPSARPGGLLPFARPAWVQSPEQREAHERITRQVGSVEVIAIVWERIMWGTAGFLALMALLSWITRYGRLWHIVAAIAILLSTAATVVGLRMLILPEYGGMPELPPRTYWALGIIQSMYGWILLVIFALPAARQSPPKEDSLPT